MIGRSVKNDIPAQRGSPGKVDLQESGSPRKLNLQTISRKSGSPGNSREGRPEKSQKHLFLIGNLSQRCCLSGSTRLHVCSGEFRRNEPSSSLGFTAKQSCLGATQNYSDNNLGACCGRLAIISAFVAVELIDFLESCVNTGSGPSTLLLNPESTECYLDIAHVSPILAP